MENIILEIIQNLNQERLKAESKGKIERAEKLLTASQILKEIYL